MSRPGSLRWWQDTALITLAGGALALWLWDGPPMDWAAQPRTAAIQTTAPLTLADMMNAGCLTQDHLQTLREGRTLSVTCQGPPATVLLRDLPPEQRPFP